MSKYLSVFAIIVIFTLIGFFIGRNFDTRDEIKSDLTPNISEFLKVIKNEQIRVVKTSQFIQL